MDGCALTLYAMTHQKLAYEVGVGLVRAAVVDDEGVDAQDAEDAMNLFVRKVVSESTRLPQEVDERLSATTRRLVQDVVVVHQHRDESVEVGVKTLSLNEGWMARAMWG